MHRLIVSPFLGEYFVLRPGSSGGIKVPHSKYVQLGRTAATSEACPTWLTDAVRGAWREDISNRAACEVLLVRAQSPYDFGRASYELNLGCNYDCEHCYLGLKTFEGMPWPDREKLLYAIRDAGVLWLQLTGGEPMIDPLFPEVYSLAYELGMMVEILSNGSRLRNPKILDLLTALRPHRISLSLYGATADSYDALTRRPGSYRTFMKGLAAAHEAGLRLDLSLIITDRNAHEADQMHALAARFGLPAREYSSMSPTIHGGAESLPSQSPEYLTRRKPFTGCDAGHTSFHVDPHGMASMCKVGRDPHIALIDDGVEGLARLAGIADGLLRRQAGCTGCTLSGSCTTCMPLVTLFRKAKAPLANYCQHTEERK